VLDVVTARAATSFHAVSEQVATDMARELRSPRSRIRVIPRARRRDLLGERTDARRIKARSALGISSTRPLVLAVGRHEHQKGLDVLVAATPALRDLVPDVLVAIAGRDGRASPALRSRIAELGLEGTVLVLGERSDVPNLVVAADVLAVPSRVEGMPGAVLEAMALETPVVASDIPMVREATGDHAVALIAVDDAPALARALHRALADPDGARASATAARRRFDERFTPEAVVAGFADIYEQAAARQGGRRSRREAPLQSSRRGQVR
jgi:glycosyltransferase involved in cell wall biosynthesis